MHKEVRVAYIPSELPAWIDVAHRLRGREGMDFRLWLSGTRFGVLDRVKEEFPQAVVLSKMDLRDEPWARRLIFSNEAPLCKETLEEISPHWETVMSLWSRTWSIDTEVDMLYSQGRHRIYILYAKLRSLLVELQINVAIFCESPHSLSGYLLYVAAKSVGVQTLMFRSTSLPNLVYPTDSIGGGRLFRAPTLDVDGVANVFMKNTDVSEFLRKIREDRVIEHNYMEVQRKYREAYSQGNAVFALRTAGGILRSFFKSRGSLEELWRYVGRRLGLMRRNRLPLAYSRHVREVCGGQRYVLVALHYQPERTTCPEGGIFDEQSLVIRMIADCLPSGWIVVVKEHPSQFQPNFRGHLGRHAEFYEVLSQVPRVQFCSIDTPNTALIDGAEAVATVTGTIGFEAALRGVPCLYFGHPWYKGMPGTFAVRTCSDLAAALEQVKLRIEIDQAEVDRFVAEVVSVSIRGHLNPSNSKCSSVSDEEWVENFATSIHDGVGEVL